MAKYDYLVVGSGLYGAVFAHEMTKRGKRCLVIDSRSHIGGNVYTDNRHDINVHVYGAHIFHTSNERVWKYINQFATFNNYTNSPIAIYNNELYNMPFNMNTFSKMWGITQPHEAKAIIAQQIADSNITKITNLEQQAISLVGVDVYTKLVKGYTEKQWGTTCDKLPAFIIRRLPLRFTYDNNYFNDKYQGIPIGGYTAIIQKLLDGIDVLLDTDYEQYIQTNPHIAHNTLYTGAIDRFFHYQLGALQYRAVKFDTHTLDIDNYQGNAVVNYTSADVPYTRIIEHKHFDNSGGDNTIISYEYPCKWSVGETPYYPINDDTNNALYQQYTQLASSRPDVIFGGRLGMYKYMDMDAIIDSALSIVEDICKYD